MVRRWYICCPRGKATKTKCMDVALLWSVIRPISSILEIAIWATQLAFVEKREMILDELSRTQTANLMKSETIRIDSAMRNACHFCNSMHIYTHWVIEQCEFISQTIGGLKISGAYSKSMDHLSLEYTLSSRYLRYSNHEDPRA